MWYAITALVSFAAGGMTVFALMYMVSEKPETLFEGEVRRRGHPI